MKDLYSQRFRCVLTWILRLAVGLVFAFSGFVKGVDIWGTVYKISEYFSALSLPVIPEVIVVLSFLLCGAEFLIGVFLLFGCYRRSVPIVALLFMAVMLPLTLWLAVKNPVSDCGCFGDAVILTNWETFWKNVILTLAIVWLLIYNNKSRNLIHPALQWIALLLSAVYFFCIGYIGYKFQPMIDFRPYDIGESLFADSNEAESEFQFIYSRDGEEHIFSADSIPDESEGWVFVDRREIPKTAKPVSYGHGIQIWSEDGSEDLSGTLNETSELLLIFVPDVGSLSVLHASPMNSLASQAEEQGVEIAAVLDASESEIDRWKDLFMPDYPIYTSEDTSLKEVVRGNPGVIYVENGRIKWKTSLGRLEDRGLTDSGSKRPIASFVNNNDSTLLKLSCCYLATMAVLVVICFCPALLSPVIRDDRKIRLRWKRRDKAVQ